MSQAVKLNIPRGEAQFKLHQKRKRGGVQSGESDAHMFDVSAFLKPDIAR